MTPEQQAAFVIAQATCATADIVAMQAENAADIAAKARPTWTGADFRAVIERYGIHHNAVIGFFR